MSGLTRPASPCPRSHSEEDTTTFRSISSASVSTTASIDLYRYNSTDHCSSAAFIPLQRKEEEGERKRERATQRETATGEESVWIEDDGDDICTLYVYVDVEKYRGKNVSNF